MENRADFDGGVNRVRTRKSDDFIFGHRAVIEAIQAGKNIDKVFLKKGLKGDLFSEVYQLMKQVEIPFQFVPEEKLNNITRLNHQGIIAFVSPIEYGKLDKLLPGIFERGEMPLLLVLDGVTDVRNFGAICRTAECTGAHAVIIPEKGSARINSEAIKTSAGALFKIPVCREKNLAASLRYLKDSGVNLVAATEKATKYHTEVDYNGPIAIIAGSEDFGISTDCLRLADEAVKIPLLGEIASLNVSIATTVVLYEAVRQRMNL